MLPSGCVRLRNSNVSTMKRRRGSDGDGNSEETGCDSSTDNDKAVGLTLRDRALLELRDLQVFLLTFLLACAEKMQSIIVYLNVCVCSGKATAALRHCKKFLTASAMESSELSCEKG